MDECCRFWRTSGSVGGSKAVYTHQQRPVAMIDPDDPLKDGLTPPDYDEYGDVPDSGENDTEPDDDSGDEANPGQSPLG